MLIPLGIAANVAVSLATTDRELLGSLLAVPPGSVALALALVATPWITQSLRMVVWTRFVGHPLSFAKALRIYAGAVLGSAVTPTAVGAGSIRWGLAARWGLPGGTAASLFSVEAVEDLLFFAVAIPVALALTSAQQSGLVERAAEEAAFGVDVQVGIAAAVVVTAVLLLWLALRLALAGRLGLAARGKARRFSAVLRRRFRRGASDVRQTLSLVAVRGKRLFLLTLCLAGIQWIARYSLATVIFVALGQAFQPVLYWLLGWLTYAVASPAPTPGAAGATEAAFVLLHSPFVSLDVLPLTSAIWRLLLFYLSATVAAVAYPLFVARDVARDRKLKEAEVPAPEAPSEGSAPRDGPVGD